jgi:hypothetical protein
LVRLGLEYEILVKVKLFDVVDIKVIQKNLAYMPKGLGYLDKD